MAFMIKTGTLALAGYTMLACLNGVAETTEEVEQHIVNDIANKSGRALTEAEMIEAEANELVSAGNALMQEKKYVDAREKYLAALGPLQELAGRGSEFFAKRVKQCQELVAQCYAYQAQDMAMAAQKVAKEEDFDKAIELCEEAKKIYPDYTKQLDEAITRYENAADVAARKNETNNLLPNQQQEQRDIELLLEQARMATDAGQYELAREKFQAVLLIDPYNVKATHNLYVVERKINLAGVERFNVDHKKMMSEVEWEAVNEIIPERSKHNLNLIDAPVKHISTADTDEVFNKLQNIIIKEAEFTDISVMNAIRYLQTLSKQNDPSGEGINIFLRLEDPAQDVQYDMNGNPISNPFGPNNPDGFGMNYPNNGFGQQGMQGGFGQQGMQGGFGQQGMQGGFGQQGMQGGFGQQGAQGGFGQQGMQGGFGQQGMQGGFGQQGMQGGFGGAVGMMPDGTAMPGTFSPYGMQQQQPMSIEDIQVNFTLSNQSLGEAIRFLCETAGLKYKVDRHAVVIATPDVALDDMETVSFPIDSEILSSFGGNDSVALMKYFYDRGISFPRGSKIAYDANISRLFVTNQTENLKKIGKMIQDSQQISEPLVMIQARFVEVRENAMKELGFNYQVSRVLPEGQNFGKLEFDKSETGLRTLTSDTIADNVFQYNREVNGYSVQAQVFALNQLDGQDILSSPRITVLNGVNATISMLRQYPVPDWGDGSEDDDEDSDSNNGSTGGGNINGGSGTDTTVQTYQWNTGQPTFEYQPFGITLSVTPLADPDRRLIQLKMNPVVTALVGWTSYVFDNSDGIVKDLPPDIIYKPITNKRAINDYVTVKDGETIVLGGIITDQTDEINDKTPLLGDIPLLGRLFQSKSTQSQKVNLLIFLHCRLVKPDGTPFYPQPEAGLADFPAYR